MANFSLPHRMLERLLSRLRTSGQLARFALLWLAWLARNPIALASAAVRTSIILRQGGVSALAGAVLYKATGRQANSPPAAWLRQYRRHVARFERRPRSWPTKAPWLILLIPTAAYRGRGAGRSLDRCLRSVLSQHYPHWQAWCVDDRPAESPFRRIAIRYACLEDRVAIVTSERALDLLRGRARETERPDYVLILDRPLEFETGAFHALADAVLADGADLVFGDHVLCDAAGAEIERVVASSAFSGVSSVAVRDVSPCPALSAALLSRFDAVNLHMALCHADCAGLVAQAQERSQRITHLPAIVALVSRHDVSRAKLRPTVAGDATKNVVRHGNDPRVAIVVPTHNAHDLLRQCVESLARTGALEVAELLIVDHRSDDPASLRYLDSLAASHRVVRADGAFNFSRLVNEGVAAAGPRYSHYLLLNNDVEALDFGWLPHMLRFAATAEVGAVGATLLYPHGTVQHAGVVLGMRGLAGHYLAGVPFDPVQDPPGHGPPDALRRPRETSAETAACLLVRADAWSAVDGFDTSLAVGYGDVDFCLRLRAAGYHVIHDAETVLIHHESSTRGRTVWDPHPGDTLRFLRRHFRAILAGDPFYSPLLSSVLTHGQLGPACPGAPRTKIRRAVGTPARATDASPNRAA